MSSEDLVVKAKRASAIRAVDENVKDGQVVGIGSGTTIVYAVQRLGERVREENLKIICVPTSLQAEDLIVANGLTLSSLKYHPHIDITIDGADEINKHTFDLIKGGGGCHIREKVVAANSKQLVIIADSRKVKDVVGEFKVPIEVVPFALTPVCECIKEIHGIPIVREGKGKLGPVMSDNGNILVDCDFGPIRSADELDRTLCCIPGIVGTGLFGGLMVTKVYIGNEDGSCIEIKKDE